MLDFPGESVFEQFFGGPAVESSPRDLFWRYEWRSADGLVLRFSFHALQRSIQTDLIFDGTTVSTVCHEGATTIDVRGDSLSCSFSSAGSRGQLSLTLRPSLRLDWSTLEV
mgnify:CR=1 FL=1